MKPLRTLLAIYVLFLLLVIITYKDANAIELSKYYKEPLTETDKKGIIAFNMLQTCLLYTSPSPRDGLLSRMPSSA